MTTTTQHLLLLLFLKTKHCSSSNSSSSAIDSFIKLILYLISLYLLFKHSGIEGIEVVDRLLFYLYLDFVCFYSDFYDEYCLYVNMSSCSCCYYGLLLKLLLLLLLFINFYCCLCRYLCYLNSWIFIYCFSLIYLTLLISSLNFSIIPYDLFTVYRNMFTSFYFYLIPCYNYFIFF